MTDTEKLEAARAEVRRLEAEINDTGATTVPKILELRNTAPSADVRICDDGRVLRVGEVTE